ncbi:terpene synthase [Xylogone sp. PMI_703]|nr:terpene synthase [Xylogone sp. PMI_703]
MEETISRYNQIKPIPKKCNNETTEILPPDMFKSFMKDEPRLHPSYAAVKADSESWIIEFCSLSAKAAEKVRQCDFTYYCAIVYQDAPIEKFRVVVNWGNWVFPFDDMFDEGELRDNPKAARDMMDCLMSKMLNLPYHGEKPKLVQAHDVIFERLCEMSSPATIQRYIGAMADYCDNVLKQVDGFTEGAVPKLDDMLKIFRVVFQHAVIKELEIIVFKMIAIVNDIVSYLKEEEDGVPHNMVAVCRMHGLSPQKAFDAVETLLDSQLAEWDRTLGQIPTWGSKIDSHVDIYIEGIRNMARANLQSSLRVERYFGKNAAKIRRTRRRSVLVNPPYFKNL